MNKYFIAFFLLAATANAQYGYIPPYTTGTLPTCDATHINRVVVDTDLDCIVVCDGAAWVCPSASASPGGADTQVQFNDAGVFGGDTGLIWTKASDILTIGGTGQLRVPDGLSATPGIRFAGGGAGLYAAGNEVYFSNPVGAVDFAEISNNRIATRAGLQFAWSASSTDITTFDTGLERTSAGVVGITNGSTGVGALESPLFADAITPTKRLQFDLATLSAATRTVTWPDVAAGTVGVIASSGFYARTGAGTTAARTISAGTGISVANGDGVAANPTISADSATQVSYTSGTGSVPATGAIGTLYFETDRPAAYTYPATDAETVLLSLPAGTGASGGIPYFTATADVIASSAALTANLPVIGGGAGTAPSVGTRSGNTTAFVTTTGAQTSGDCVKIDANGNHIANGSACGGTMDINGLTAEPLINPFDDTLPFYDSSAAANRKAAFGIAGLAAIGRSYWKVETDFIGGDEAYVDGSAIAPWFNTRGGAGSAMETTNGVAGHPGIKRFTSGTTTTGFAGLISQGMVDSHFPIVLGDGRVSYTTWIRISALSDGTDTYSIRMGLGSNNTVSGTQNDAVLFTYTDSINSGKWRGICRKDGTPTNVDDTGAAVAAATWYRLNFVANATATSIEFFVDGTSIGTCATNIPLTTDPIGPNLLILKSAGTTSRDLDVDAFSVIGEIVTTR